jgi:uncharacterized membrane protein
MRRTRHSIATSSSTELMVGQSDASDAENGNRRLIMDQTIARHIYRFEILSEATGAPGHAIYEARDSHNGSNGRGPGAAGPETAGGPDHGPKVTLFEWTPEPSELEESLIRLSTAIGEVPDVELFSSGSAIYLAAPDTADPKTALEALRSRGLFPGPWPGFADLGIDSYEEEPVPQEPPRELPRAAMKAGKSSSHAWRVTTLLVAIGLILTIVLVSLMQSLSSAKGEAQQLRERMREQDESLRGLRDRLGEQTGEQTKATEMQRASEGEIQRLKSGEKRFEDLAAEYTRLLKSAPEGLQVGAAKLISDSFAARQKELAAQLGSSVHQIHLVNHCGKSTLDVVVHYKGLDDRWVTDGWWTLKPNEDAHVAYSRETTYYVYAKAENGSLEWLATPPAGAEMQIVRNLFTHIEGEEILGRNKQKVRMFRQEFSTAEDKPTNFTCP